MATNQKKGLESIPEFVVSSVEISGHGEFSCFSIFFDYSA